MLKKSFYNAILIPILTLTACSKVDQSTGVLIYRQLPEFSISQLYSVEVKQNEGYQSIFTYMHEVPQKQIFTKQEHWTAFAFDSSKGKAQVRISMLDGTILDENNSELVNKSYKDAIVHYEGGKMIIDLTSSEKHLFVRVKDKERLPLTIFADPFSLPEIPEGAKVVRFEYRDSAYVMNQEYDRYTVPNDVDVVYIEDGVLFKGTVWTDYKRTKPLLLMGRGVIIGNGPVVYKIQGIPYNAIKITRGTHHQIHNLMVINSRHFGMDIGKNGWINNVKLFGYEVNNDGIVAGKNSRITNSYFKVNDDHIKIYYDSLYVSNCNFYVQWNGGVLQNGWNKIGGAKDVLVENCEVVACEFKHAGDPKLGQGGIAHTFLSWREAEAHKYAKNHIYRNILIQGQLIRFAGINGKYEPSIGCSFENILLENINVINEPLDKSWIYIPDKHKVSITFKNVKFGNRPVNINDFITEGDVELSFVE